MINSKTFPIFDWFGRVRWLDRVGCSHTSTPVLFEHFLFQFYNGVDDNTLSLDKIAKIFGFSSVLQGKEEGITELHSAFKVFIFVSVASTNMAYTCSSLIMQMIWI